MELNINQELEIPGAKSVMMVGGTRDLVDAVAVVTQNIETGAEKGEDKKWRDNKRTKLTQNS